MARKSREKPTVKQILYPKSTDAEEKLILIALREHASSKGWAVKSYGELAELTKLSEGTVRDRVTKLLKREVLERPDRQKPHDKSAYKVHMYNFRQDVESPIDKADKAAIKYVEQLAKQMPSLPIGNSTNDKLAQKQIVAAVAGNKLPHPSQPAKPQSETE
jgi:hypothetical protein